MPTYSRVFPNRPA